MADLRHQPRRLGDCEGAHAQHGAGHGRMSRCRDVAMSRFAIGREQWPGVEGERGAPEGIPAACFWVVEALHGRGDFAGEEGELWVRPVPTFQASAHALDESSLVDGMAYDTSYTCRMGRAGSPCSVTHESGSAWPPATTSAVLDRRQPASAVRGVNVEHAQRGERERRDVDTDQAPARHHRARSTDP